ncbi:hypothetical protein DB35_23980 [Streptomyces abyssalis]|uniref:Uncharacterized protein n=2 Tax=Streptomyces abyssalis TaxID=933944 RepID=A0A1E7JNS6_9ACTN|nr:hypothetical protein DB35_23980 [Streptomyces abyssalis]OEU89890.1 hypothetical protein AN215_09555 [Streptomyces abyssalis]
MMARRVRSTTPRLPGILLAVLLVLSGGSAAMAQQPHAQGAPAQGQSAGAHQQDPPQHFQGAIAHAAHAATHAPLPLLPAVGQNGPEAEPGSVRPERPRLSATHLTHRSPPQGRAPPARTGI